MEVPTAAVAEAAVGPTCTHLIVVIFFQLVLFFEQLPFLVCSHNPATIHARRMFDEIYGPVFPVLTAHCTHTAKLAR